MCFTSGNIYWIRPYLGLRVNQGAQRETKKMALITQNIYIFIIIIIFFLENE